MSQEHRFCAEIYARLFSLIDRSKRIVVNPDGQEKLPGHTDPGSPPDLCFTLCGLREELCIEANFFSVVNSHMIETSKIVQLKLHICIN